MYLALQRVFASDFLNYPKTTKLLVTKKLSVITKFLEQKGSDSVYSSNDIDYELDFFLYLDTLNHKVGGKYFSYPFSICIECDGHEFHERTPEQAKKDKSKDRVLKEKGIDVIRFTGTEITREPDKCAEQVLSLYHAHYRKIAKLLESYENT
nr:DUF559 domain-containing protein [Vibrio coralliilyticus]